MFGYVGGEKETCYGNGEEMRFYVHEDGLHPVDHAAIRHLHVFGAAIELECGGHHRVGCHFLCHDLVDCLFVHVHRVVRTGPDPSDRGRDQHRYGLLELMSL